MEKVENIGKYFIDNMLVFSVTLLTIVKFIHYSFKTKWNQDTTQRLQSNN